MRPAGGETRARSKAEPGHLIEWDAICQQQYFGPC